VNLQRREGSISHAQIRTEIETICRRPRYFIQCVIRRMAISIFFSLDKSYTRVYLRGKLGKNGTDTDSCFRFKGSQNKPRGEAH